MMRRGRSLGRAGPFDRQESPEPEGREKLVCPRDGCSVTFETDEFDSLQMHIRIDHPPDPADVAAAQANRGMVPLASPTRIREALAAPLAEYCGDVVLERGGLISREDYDELRQSTGMQPDQVGAETESEGPGPLALELPWHSVRQPDQVQMSIAESEVVPVRMPLLDAPDPAMPDIEAPPVFEPEARVVGLAVPKAKAKVRAKAGAHAKVRAKATPKTGDHGDRLLHVRVRQPTQTVRTRPPFEALDARQFLLLAGVRSRVVARGIVVVFNAWRDRAAAKKKAWAKLKVALVAHDGLPLRQQVHRALDVVNMIRPSCTFKEQLMTMFDGIEGDDNYVSAKEFKEWRLRGVGGLAPKIASIIDDYWEKFIAEA